MELTESKRLLAKRALAITEQFVNRDDILAHMASHEGERVIFNVIQRLQRGRY